MSTSKRTIASYLAPSGQFYRSISIERDRDDDAVLNGYVLTPWLQRVGSEILSGLLPGSRRRAWRVTGDFGVGKSALALALIRTTEPCAARKTVASLQQLAKSAGPGLPRMRTLVVSGSRAGLTTALAQALHAEASREAGLLGDAAIHRLANSDPFDGVIHLRDALVASGKYDGLLIVIDEMGKFLETAASDPASGDVFRLQELAEFASRSGDQPLAVLLILHQGLQSYQQDGDARRTEWSKVAERFEELVFDHPLSHTSALLSAALAPEMDKLPQQAAAQYQHASDKVSAIGWSSAAAERLLAPCYPLHPACVPVLSRFFASFGQNERSLFGFAASEEPNSLRAFAADAPTSAGLYGLERFFDYVTSSFGHRLITRSGAGDWERIRAVLDGASASDPVESAVLKVVGLLNLIDAPDLLATEETLQACLYPDFSTKQIKAAVVALRTNGILFERVIRNGLRLWTSRRVDLSNLWQQADRAVPAEAISHDLASTLSQQPIRPFLLARRHSIQTGVTRRFPVKLVPASALASTRLHGDADGQIIVVLPSTLDEVRLAKQWAAEATQDDHALIACVAPTLNELKPLALDLLRHRWIEANATSLREDAFAAAEIDRRLAELERTLVDRLESLLGLSGEPPHDEVVVLSAGARVKDPAPMHILVSVACDRLFERSPLVQNELINRHSLTSAAAGARLRLIEAMFASAHDPDLGFSSAKSPPERALYLSVLKSGGLHRERAGVYGIDLPDPTTDCLRLLPALSSLRERLAASDKRVDVPELYALLAAAPFGVRAGLSPVLLTTVLVANKHRIALFERGTYCPKLDAQAFMRVLKSPEHFALQWIALEGVRADVFQRLAAVLGRDEADQGLLAVVAPLVRFAAGLNLHAQRSSALSDQARGVLDALLRTRSPVDLIFIELPRACGLEPFEHDQPPGKTDAAAFAESLESAIAELQSCYPSLLDGMRSDLGQSLQINKDLRTELLERTRPLMFAVREQAMRTFIQRISDSVLSDDAWIEALGGALLGKPPSRWLSQDVASWQARLADASQAFLRLEATAFNDGGGRRHAVRLAVTHLDGRDTVSVLSLDEETEEQERFTRSILKLIEENGTSASIILARLAESLLVPEQTSGNESKAEAR